MTHLDVGDMSLEAVAKSGIHVQSDDSSSDEDSLRYSDSRRRGGMCGLGTHCFVITFRVTSLLELPQMTPCCPDIVFIRHSKCISV